MFSFQTTRSNARVLSAEFPIGDPFGGPAYGERRDLGTIVGGVGGFLVGGPAGASIGASIGGSLGAAGAQADAATQAAQTSANASNYAADIQRQIFEQQRTDSAPWRTAGVNALAQLTQGTAPGGEYMRDFGMSDFQQDPGYQFRLSEGLKALDRSSAARGGLLSGGALKGISRYGQDYASNEYGNAFNRFQTNRSNKLQPLQSLAGIGQTATNALGQAGQNYAGNVGNYAMTAGGNAATAQLIGGQGRASAYQGIGNALGRVNWGELGGGSTGGYVSGAYVPDLLDQQYAQGWGYGD